MGKKAIFIALALFLLMPIGVSLAQEDTRRVTDETVHGDVTLMGRSFDLSETGQVNGSVSIFNGDATIAGTINGDLVVFGGKVTVLETAVINGECVAINGSVSFSEGVESNCYTLDELPFAGNILGAPESPLPPSIEPSISHPITRAVGASGLSILMGLLAMTLYAVAPTSSERIVEAMRKKPLATSAVGLLSFGAVPFINLLLLLISIPLLLVCIGILGFPIIMGLTFAFIVAGFWSWMLWGKLFGEWFTRRIRRKPSPLFVVAGGTAVLTFIFAFLAFSGTGWAIFVSIVTLVPLAWGMGAAALTRFGTRTYPLLIAPAPKPEKLQAVLDTLPDEIN